MGDRVHSAGCALSEVIVYFFFIHLFLVFHVYRHSLSMLSNFTVLRFENKCGLIVIF